MTFTEEAWLLFIGGVIGLVSALVGGFVQHLLSLRADSIKRERDKQQRESERFEELERLTIPSEADTEKIASVLALWKEQYRTIADIAQTADEGQKRLGLLLWAAIYLAIALAIVALIGWLH